MSGWLERENYALPDHRRACVALRDPAEGIAFQRARQAAEEKGNLQADQRSLPPLRFEGNGGLC